jgi:MarC family integral membrane protein
MRLRWNTRKSNADDTAPYGVPRQFPRFQDLPADANVDLMTKFLGYVAGALLAILPIVNPLGAVPLVMTVAAHLPAQERLRQIRRACVYTFVMMAGFLLAGGLIMSLFGISFRGMRGRDDRCEPRVPDAVPQRAAALPRARAGDWSQGRHRLHAARHARSRGRRHLCRDLGSRDFSWCASVFSSSSTG